MLSFSITGPRVCVCVWPPVCAKIYFYFGTDTIFHRKKTVLSPCVGGRRLPFASNTLCSAPSCLQVFPMLCSYPTLKELCVCVFCCLRKQKKKKRKREITGQAKRKQARAYLSWHRAVQNGVSRENGAHTATTRHETVAQPPFPSLHFR